MLCNATARRILTQEPPLSQQVLFELFEVITKSHILLGKVEITFKSNKKLGKVIAYFRF